MFLKLSQTNWNVAKNNVNVVVGELQSQIIVYTCLIIDIWTQRTSMRFYALSMPSAHIGGVPVNLVPKVFDFFMASLARRKALSESYATYKISC